MKNVQGHPQFLATAQVICERTCKESVLDDYHRVIDEIDQQLTRAATSSGQVTPHQLSQARIHAGEYARRSLALCDHGIDRADNQIDFDAVKELIKKSDSGLPAIERLREAERLVDTQLMSEPNLYLYRRMRNPRSLIDHKYLSAIFDYVYLSITGFPVSHMPPPSSSPALSSDEEKIAVAGARAGVHQGGRGPSYVSSFFKGLILAENEMSADLMLIQDTVKRKEIRKRAKEILQQRFSMGSYFESTQSCPVNLTLIDAMYEHVWPQSSDPNQLYTSMVDMIDTRFRLQEYFGDGAQQIYSGAPTNERDKTLARLTARSYASLVIADKLPVKEGSIDYIAGTRDWNTTSSTNASRDAQSTELDTLGDTLEF